MSSALWCLGSTPARFWYDDLRQCALIALWRTSDARDRADRSEAYTVARRAALSELRNVTGHRRTAFSWEPGPDVHHDTPDSIAAAGQAVQIMRDMPPQYVAAVTATLECDTRRQAALRLGVDPSRLTHILTGQQGYRTGSSVRERLAAAV